MKKVILILSLLISFQIMAQSVSSKTALLLIDIQNFYFPEGKWELVDPDEAGENAKLLLDHFRNTDQLVIHVRHDTEPGGEIHQLVKPLKSEDLITKQEVNSFKNTELLNILKENGIETLVICGMQTHMCVEAATRAAADFDFKCILVKDACATRDLNFDGENIAARKVHLSTLSTLTSYAQILDTKTYLSQTTK